ncbi:hypothetical protein UlMin_012117 [Ulmus minor]
MDTVKSFKGYGKVNHELEQQAEQAFRRRVFWRRVFIVALVVFLLALVAGIAAFTVIKKKGSSSSPAGLVPTQLTPSASLKAICGVTPYPDSCFSSISKLETNQTTDPEVLFKLSLRVAVEELSRLSGYPKKLQAKATDPRLRKALAVCDSVLEDAIDHLNDSISSMEVGQGKSLLSVSKIDDLKTWLSASLTDQETCLDALEELNSTLLPSTRTQMSNSTEFVSNALAIASKIMSLLVNFNIPIHRRLMGYKQGFPEWVSRGDRRLLQENNLTVHVTVAKDGTGDFTTIGEAVDRVPKKKDARFVIHVKQGVYVENVLLDKGKWNVMIYGDGKDKTIVSGSLNFVDGTPTFATATFAVQGKGFMARDIGFINTAGPQKHQAVAFRSGSDLSVYYRCSFDGYQDTLYAHSNRQFYRDCDITGTIDFIFGNAAVVFQGCTIQPRQPLPNQFNTITAQGKKEVDQNTGISIQKCTFSAKDANLTALTYLGRPWKEFSTTVIMQSEIGSFLNPLGWKEWVNNVDPPSTIFYAEYSNSGPGSSVDQRVKWAGYKPTLTLDEASKFSVEYFIQGPDWLPDAGVEFDAKV